MNTNKELIELIETLISTIDPTPVLVNSEFPLRWESNIFMEDYDFSENYLDLNHEDERSGGMFLKSVGTAIELVKEEDGSYEYWDGIFMIESHSWCSKLNSDPNFPSFSLINQKFKDLKELTDFLVELHS